MEVDHEEKSNCVIPMTRVELESANDREETGALVMNITADDTKSGCDSKENGAGVIEINVDETNSESGIEENGTRVIEINGEETKCGSDIQESDDGVMLIESQETKFEIGSEENGARVIEISAEETKCGSGIRESDGGVMLIETQETKFEIGSEENGAGVIEINAEETKSGNDIQESDVGAMWIETQGMKFEIGSEENGALLIEINAEETKSGNDIQESDVGAMLIETQGTKFEIGSEENGALLIEINAEETKSGNDIQESDVGVMLIETQETKFEIGSEENGARMIETNAEKMKSKSYSGEPCARVIESNAEELKFESDSKAEDDEESDSSEDDENTDSSEDEEDDESDEVSLADSEEEDVMPTKNRKMKIGHEDDEEKKLREDGELPRTKHDVEVLPPVPKVTAVLEPHHVTVSVGRISSIVDLNIIVEGSNDSKVLNENTILWLTESRVPLGIVDEVFGPVKRPFYLVRFNEISEVPKDAKTGLDVSYVTEFSEFVLKDDPCLYKKAVDASGLDDEELASDEDLEFSDDEKEAEARLRERSKRGLDSRDNGPGRDRNSAEGQFAPTRGQRRNRGRGHGHGGGNGSFKPTTVDSAVERVAGMDLRGPPRPLSNSGNKQQHGRGRFRESLQRQSFQQRSAHKESQVRGSGPGPGHTFRTSPQQRESSQRGDDPCFTEQVNTQMHPIIANQQAFQASNIGAMQGPGIHIHQPLIGFHPFGINNIPGYGINMGTNGQGNLYPVPSVPQLSHTPVFFNNPSLNLNPPFTNQGQAPLNFMSSPGNGSTIHAVQTNYGLHHSLGDRQVGGYPTIFSGGRVLPDLVFQSMPQNQNVGPVFAGRVRNRGEVLSGQQRNFPSNRGSPQGQ